MQNSVALHYFKMRLSGAICLLTSGGVGVGVLYPVLENASETDTSL